MTAGGKAINGDLTVRAVMDTNSMEWTASPSGTVWRKRVHLVGAPESGQVTSIVRYQPDASFPAHDHPAGEEILVLEGVFSDEHGDWPAGTYLLNPEGFRHAPFSREGCLLFVKLRQFPGLDREHHVIDTGTREWQVTDHNGVWRKPLYGQPGYADIMHLERWEAGTTAETTHYEQGAEFFVLDGEFEDDEGVYPAGSWLRLPAGGSHTPGTSQGCELYVKLGGIPYLRSG
jgi:anti-sigma factor ChrR (cupin superfamily)